MDVVQLNEQLKTKFYKNKNYQTLEKYVMSELLSPIQDYANANRIIKDNIGLLENLNLLFIATFISSEYLFCENEFLQLLDDKIETVSDKDKAIIYFLKANHIICTDKNWRGNDICKKYLRYSVEYSKDFNFANNRFYLAQCLTENVKLLAKETLCNITKIDNYQSLKQKNEQYWLSSQRFIDEFILGTSVNSVVYKQKEQYLQEMGLI